MIERSAIINALHDTLVTWLPARAAWLAGSDASGRTDCLSDIDLQVIVEDRETELCFARVEDALRDLSAIAVSMRLPRPTWHGHEQAFYQLADADPFHMIDMVVMKRSGNSANRFLEPERHGQPLILFDHDGLIIPTPLDRSANQRRIEDRISELRSRFLLFQPLVTKAILRGHAAEAVHFYHAMTLRPLIELLRIRHCPDRFDFGARYLDRDLPSPLAAEIDRLSFPVDAAGLTRNRQQCEDMFLAAMAEIDRGGA